MLTQKFIIRANECDKFGLVKLSSLVGYLIEIAGNDATQLNFGYDELNSKGKYWVLSRLLIDAEILPQWREEIQITTWPKGIHKLFALRDFIITDFYGKETIKVTTCWLVLDRQNNRPNKIESVITDFSCIINKNAIDKLPDKIDNPQIISEVYSKKVLMSDIDVNEHVNSCKYIDWIMDCINFENQLKKNKIKIQVNFVGAAKLFDNVKLNMGVVNETNVLIEAINSDKNNKFVQSIIMN